MDSVPTGSMQSWVIVASASVSPTVLPCLADAIGQLFRHGKGERANSARLHRAVLGTRPRIDG
jgi:hypothetical protein